MSSRSIFLSRWRIWDRYITNHRLLVKKGLRTYRLHNYGLLEKLWFIGEEMYGLEAYLMGSPKSLRAARKTVRVGRKMVDKFTTLFPLALPLGSVVCHLGSSLPKSPIWHLLVPVHGTCSTTRDNWWQIVMPIGRWESKEKEGEKDERDAWKDRE